MAQAKLVNGIVGSYQNSDIDKVCKAVCDNMYYETQDKQASVPAILRSISGTSVLLDMPERGCRGIYRCSRGKSGQPALYACFGSHVYLILEEFNAFRCYEIGRVSNASKEPVRFTETGGYGDAHPHLIVVDGSACFAVDTTLDPEYQNADWKAIRLPYRQGTPNTPITPTHCTYLYGYLAVNDAGTDVFYLSVQYPFEETKFGDDIFMTSKYGGYGFVVYSEWMTDNTTALIGTGSNLWTFGPRSYQVFSYMNDVNYPFQSADTAAAAIGIRAPKSLAAVGDLVFWLGSSDIGQNGIYVGQGRSVQRVSTYDIEREIDKMSYPEDAIAQCWQENRHIFYAISFVTDARTFVYDVTEKVWHTRSSYDQTKPDNMGIWRPQYSTFAYNKIIYGTLEDNKLIYLDNSRWNEYDDLVMVRTRVSSVIMADFSPWFCNYLRLICNNGQTDDPELNPQVTMRYSFDGSEWSDQVIGLIGEVGKYYYHTEWWGLGVGEILSLEFTCSDNFNFTIVAAKLGADASSIY